MGLTFDDVLIRPNYSEIMSRRDCDTSTFLTEGIKLNIPIISANMDTVTEEKMAIKMALLGGIGIIHRYMTIEAQASKIRAVKRFTSSIIDKPFTLRPECPISTYIKAKSDLNVSTFPIVNERNELYGIVTSRDLWKGGEKIKDIMTLTGSLFVLHHDKYNDQDALDMINKHGIKQIPIIDKDTLELKGLVTRKDLVNIKEKYPLRALDQNKTLLVGAAVGVKQDASLLSPLIQAGANVLVIDIAHGHHKLVLDTLEGIKKTFKDIPVIVGNVATIEAVEMFKDKADGIKVGIGEGAACITRVVTGCGVPQFTAIKECSKNNYPYLIADGGIQTSGDVTKAIFAGASTVMIGSMLAATSDSSGDLINLGGKKVKIYRGMASHESYFENTDNSDFHFAQEGVSGYVDYKGETDQVIKDLVSGLKSGMSYTGSEKIKDLQQYGRFINTYYKVTSKGYLKSKNHSMSDK